MVWDLRKNGSKVMDTMKEDRDKRTYILPEVTQEMLEERAHEMGATAEDLLTLIVSIGLSERKDLRELFVNKAADKLREEYSKLTSLDVGDITLNFDRVDIKEFIDLEENKFLIHIDYFLGEAKVASRIERPLEKVNSINNAYNMYDVGVFKK